MSMPTRLAAPDRARHVSPAWAVRDALTVTWRNLIALTRNPELMVFATIQPVIFVLMFRYVFGGAIQVPGVPYVDYLMPGIWAQTVVFGAITTAVGLAEDLHTGLIERFRSLPMARSAMLVGRTNADVVRNVFVVALMCAVGFAVGFRNHTSALALLAALGLMLFLGYSLSWLFAVIGLWAPTAETAQAAAFPIVAVLTFASSAFVPVATMPGWLQPFARNQPVSVTVNAARALVLGGPTAHYVALSIAWIIAIVGVCAPLTVQRYRRVT